MATDRILYIDYESYSSKDIKKAGAYQFVAAQDYASLLLSWAYDDQPFQVHDYVLSDTPHLPEHIAAHIQDGGRVASFGNFDRLCLNRDLAALELQPLPLEQFIDVMVLCNEYNAPGSLRFAADFFDLEQAKDPIGRKAIQAFCKPKKGRRQLPTDSPELCDLWKEFRNYCHLDGVLLRAIHHRLPELTPAERMLFEMDCRINDYGIRIDTDSAAVLNALVDDIKARLNEILEDVTEGQVKTVGQVARIAEYCGTTNTTQTAMEAAIKDPALTVKQRQVARIRLAGARSSASKLPTMLEHAHHDDHRARGCLRFAAAITNRWISGGPQFHNFPRDCWNEFEFLQFMEAAYRGLPALVKMYPNPLQGISKCLRPLIVPEIGNKFVVADYAQIEARLVAWYGGQQDILKLYERGEDVYKEMAAAIYEVPLDQVNDSQRFIGKTVVLGSGYKLGAAGLQRNLSHRGIEIDIAEAEGITYSFRRKFHMVTRWWGTITEALWKTFESDRIGHRTLNGGKLKFGKEETEAGTSLYIELSTGMKIWYHGVRKVTEPTPWNNDPEDTHVVLRALNPRGAGTYVLTTSILAENICSATAREILGRAMWRLEKAGMQPVLSVHDEIIVEVPEDRGSVNEVEEIMCQRPTWGRDIPLAVEAQVMMRYGK